MFRHLAKITNQVSGGKYIHLNFSDQHWAMYAYEHAVYRARRLRLRWTERQLQQEPGCADSLSASITVQRLNLRLP